MEVQRLRLKRGFPFSVALCSCQGAKKGIMEVADLVVVNKADGPLLQAAQRTCSQYRQVVSSPPDK